MKQYILQHIGRLTQDPLREKISREKVNGLIDSGFISGGGGCSIEFKGKVSIVSNRRIKEMLAEEYLYAMESGESEAHYVRAVSGIFGKIFLDISEIEQCLDWDEINKILSSLEGDKIRMWGVEDGEKGGTLKQFRKIKNEDTVLFIYDKNLVGIGDVLLKIEGNKELSTAVWNDAKYQNIYFIKNFSEVSEDKSLLKEIKGDLDYKQGTNFQNLIIIDKNHNGYGWLKSTLNEMKSK